jgi:outer membrane receptor protein involved in Fe transport
MENIFDKEYASGYVRDFDITGNTHVYQTYGLPRNVVVGYVFTF